MASVRVRGISAAIGLDHTKILATHAVQQLSGEDVFVEMPDNYLLPDPP